MRVSDTEVAALRAYVTGNIEEYKRLRGRFGREQIQPFVSLIAAVFLDAVDLRFDEGRDQATVIEYVAGLRARSKWLRDGLDPVVAERLIRYELGKGSVHDLDGVLVATTRQRLLVALIPALGLNATGLSRFLARSRRLADHWLARMERERAEADGRRAPEHGERHGEEAPRPARRQRTRVGDRPAWPADGWAAFLRGRGLAWLGECWDARPRERGVAWLRECRPAWLRLPAAGGPREGWAARLRKRWNAWLRSRGRGRPVTADEVAAIRAYLSQSGPGMLWPIVKAGLADPLGVRFSVFVLTVFSCQVTRRFPPDATDGEVIRFVALARAGEPSIRDLDPRLCEELILSALGRPPSAAADGKGKVRRYRTRLILMHVLAAELGLDDAGVDELLAEARKRTAW